MSDVGKAVFLSYASQDAEAAKRIADALRAAGVEVWFDAEGGLEHGDEWDAKIRRQIKECVLFLPVISANTQAREEGYFRIEWELAAQRALGIASGVAFILPVVIDGTREPDALVPDRFRSVQWTRLPGGAVPPEVLQRFLKLWSHRTGALKHAATRTVESVPAASPLVRRPVWPWVAGGLTALAVAYVAMKPRPGQEVADRMPAEAQKPGSAAIVTPTRAGQPAVRAPGPAPEPSEARQLVAKALLLLRSLEATREDFALAEEYCQRALKLDPDDGEVWAASSQVNAAFVYRGWEATSARKEQTRVMAERAIRLAPTSIEARLAQAGAWATFGINREEREKLLREVVRDDPANQGALRFLAVTVLSKPDGLAECLALNERSAALPGGDPLALFNNARYLLDRGNVAEAYATLQRSIAQKPFVSALVLRMSIEITRRGDLAAAEETLRQIPQSALQEDRANYIAGLLRYYQRNAAAALDIWQAFPRDYYRDFIFEGPKGLLIGLAYELDHRDAAAKIEWRTALPIVEKNIAAAPNKAGPYLQQALLLACLGEKAAAGEALRTHEQLEGLRYSADQPMGIAVARVYARLGRFDEIFAHPPGGRNVLRASPDFDVLRADPRFAAWTAEAGNPAKPPAGMDDKSVAVLAFANLSEDKNNEYFSDGISEELLNVLAKVPGLKVSARTSAFYFKGKDIPIPEIAQKLGVAYVVEGSVRKAGDKVRITAQLIKAADGFHVWSDTFTRDLKDIFAVQDEIAGLVAQQLQLKLGGGGARVAVDPALYELLLQARALTLRESNEDWRQAAALYRRTLEKEPSLALAWAEMARIYVQLGRFGGMPIQDAMREARTAAQRALELEPDQATGLVALGWVQRTADWDWRAARRSFQRALELAPGNASIMGDVAVFYFNTGRVTEATTLARQAVERDPLNARAQASLGFILNLNGDWELALAPLRQAVALAPSIEEVRSHTARALSALGRLDESAAVAEQEPNEAYRLIARAFIPGPAADAALAEFVAKYGEEMPGYVANIHGIRGEVDPAFAWFERALARRDAAVVWVKTNVNNRSLRADPRWPDFLRKVGLADDQLK